MAVAKDKTKNSVILDSVINLESNIVIDDILFADVGLNSSKQAMCAEGEASTTDSLFEIFERAWSANQTQKLVKDVKNEIVLEMGCADLRTYNSFKAIRFYPNFIGVDIRSDYLKNNKTKSRKDVLAICADITKNVPLKDEIASVIILSEVIEHLTYDQNILFFKEAYRLLKPGGKILVSSPMNTKDRKFHSLEKEADSLGHVFFWDAEDFEKEILGLGFSDVDKKWGFSTSSAIRIHELKKSMHPEVQKFVESISDMYGGQVARALALSAPEIVNGGCRFVVTK